MYCKIKQNKLTNERTVTYIVSIHTYGCGGLSLYRAVSDRAGLFDTEIQRKCQRKQTDREADMALTAELACYRKT